VRQREATWIPGGFSFLTRGFLGWTGLKGNGPSILVALALSRIISPHHYPTASGLHPAAEDSAPRPHPHIPSPTMAPEPAPCRSIVAHNVSRIEGVPPQGSTLNIHSRPRVSLKVLLAPTCQAGLDFRRHQKPSMVQKRLASFIIPSCVTQSLQLRSPYRYTGANSSFENSFLLQILFLPDSTLPDRGFFL